MAQDRTSRKRRKIGADREIFGLHAARSALSNPSRKVARAWVSKAVCGAFDDMLSGIETNICTSAEISARLGKDEAHQGIVLEAEPLLQPNIETAIEKMKLVILADGITDPRNFGAILRSAAFFGAEAIITTRHNSPPINGVLAKAACGGLEEVALIHIPNLARIMEQMKKGGFTLLGLDERGAQTITEQAKDTTPPLALVLGAEGKGLRRLTREHCDHLVHLGNTKSQAVSSLNVSVAAALGLATLANK